MRVLGIETSCDETAAAIVERREDGSGQVLSNVIRSQWEEHRAFGGVVPEIAARAHVACLDEIIARAMQDAGMSFEDIDAIAATAGPGLIGGLLVGLVTAKSIAMAHSTPFVAINHLEAHALTVGLTDHLDPPYILLLVSGGHTQTIYVAAFGRYHRLGTTIDDALGEAFDKTAKLLGLGFPGGPAVERAAAKGDARRFAFPRPLSGRSEPHFSFAGLKTAVRRQAQKLEPVDDRAIADLCASFEAAVCDSVADRLMRAYAMADAEFGANRKLPLVAAGGVARNVRLRGALERVASSLAVDLYVPPPELCTDNGAMIAWAGAEHYVRGRTDGWDATARARWPLDESSLAVYGSG
ncbi:MAG: tRNA (adenosine(37)-N6)-threonylcarbamoyltransferase complex transferase subunit TsaD, partial [Hyphomicrobiaceae bacterium]